MKFEGRAARLQIGGQTFDVVKWTIEPAEPEPLPAEPEPLPADLQAELDAGVVDAQGGFILPPDIAAALWQELDRERARNLPWPWHRSEN